LSGSDHLSVTIADTIKIFRKFWPILYCCLAWKEKSKYSRTILLLHDKQQHIFLS